MSDRQGKEREGEQRRAGVREPGCGRERGHGDVSDLGVKKKVYLALEDPSHATGLARGAGIALIVLIVTNALLVGASDPSVPGDVRSFARVFGLASTVVFGLEYVCRIWVADLSHPELAPTRARVRYVCSAMGLVDVLAFAPMVFVLLAPESEALAEAVRVIRLVRLIKLSHYMRGLATISRVIAKHRHEIVASFMVLALMCIAASVLMYEAEHAAQPEKFDSVLTGLYWAMTTMTSTGYGDLVPITPAGRLVGFATMALSVAVVAIPAGIFSAGFVAEFRRGDSGSSLAHADDVRSGGVQSAADADTAEVLGTNEKGSSDE